MSGNSEADRRPRLLLLDDGDAGHWRQVVALAERLGGEHEILRVRLRAPWRWLAPRRLPLGRIAHRRVFGELSAEAPWAIVSCGPRTALVLRWLRKQWDGYPLSVQIRHCGLDPRHFDWVVTPRHDRVAGPNVIRTLGSLNPVDDAWLESAMPAGPLAPEPRVAILVGGHHRDFPLRRGWLRQTLDEVAGIVGAAGGHPVVVAGPDSPPWVAAVAANAGKGVLRRMEWNASGMNVLAGQLASATHLVVTADSVERISEACATGRPVLIAGADRARGRLGDFTRAVLGDGYARDLSRLRETLDDDWQPRPLRETHAVAIRLLRSGLFG